jgi:hypothetical protein
VIDLEIVTPSTVATNVPLLASLNEKVAVPTSA